MRKYVGKAVAKHMANNKETIFKFSSAEISLEDLFKGEKYKGLNEKQRIELAKSQGWIFNEEKKVFIMK